MLYHEQMMLHANHITQTPDSLARTEEVAESAMEIECDGAESDVVE